MRAYGGISWHTLAAIAARCSAPARELIEARMQLAHFARRQKTIGPVVAVGALDLGELESQTAILGPRELTRSPSLLEALLETRLALAQPRVARHGNCPRGRCRGKNCNETCPDKTFHDSLLVDHRSTQRDVNVRN